MGAYQYFQELKSQKIQKARQEGWQEEREKQKRFEDALRKQGVSEDKIQSARELSSSSSNER